MSAIRSVVLAIDMATRRRDDASRALMEIQRSCRSAQDQMDQLESYAADTDSKWAVAAQVRATPEVVHHYYQFMARLQQAIDLQRRAIDKLDLEFMAAKRLLLDAEIRIASLQQLLNKKQSGINRLHAAREQKHLDEFAAMQHRRLSVAVDTLEKS
jgi:flagellar FliJ protein